MCQLHKIHMLQKYPICVTIAHLPSRLPSLCASCFFVVLFCFVLFFETGFLCVALEPALGLQSCVGLIL